MARRSISIDEKIARQKQLVFKDKDKYDADVAELDRLEKKRDDRDATGKNGAVASCNWYASKAGLEILKEGGNAFDAAAAVAYTLGVAEPYFSGLGGGGFMTIYSAKDDKVSVLDHTLPEPSLPGWALKG